MLFLIYSVIQYLNVFMTTLLVTCRAAQHEEKCYCRTLLLKQSKNITATLDNGYSSGIKIRAEMSMNKNKKEVQQ